MLLFTLSSNFSRLLYTNHFYILSPYRVSQERILMRGAIPVQAIILLLLCFRVLSQSDGSTAPMEEKEKEALYLMIQGFVGNWWNGSGLYPDPCGWTSIQGVSCDLFENGFWYVTTVNIGPILDNSLRCSNNAEFSSSLFELSHLRSFSIFNCFSSPFHKETIIPSQSWNKLSSSLETLEFRLNKGLTGQIPRALGQLVNLKSLVLTENSLIGELPWEIGNLVHLKRLTISANQLSGKIPASFGTNLAELLIMDLSNNSLTGHLPSSFGGLASLLKLDVSNNILTGNIPQELCKLKNLILLDLRNNNLSGGLPPSLQTMLALQDMLLSNNPLGGSIKEFSWENLKNLTHLDLSNTELVGEIPDSITDLQKLRVLALDGNQLSGFVSPKLADMPSLFAVYLNGNNFAGELRFSQEFYNRMGRRFASWNNPNLCYGFKAGNTTREGPDGVSKCNYGENRTVHNLDAGNKAGRVETTQSSASMASIGFSASTIARYMWISFLEIVVIIFLWSSM
ncbi:piriformospora indica-insensitive protein 2 isoform X1 [Dendrobium catenatum]|uniref:Piriformospora indica-insensitive protein 2 n=2 Tax=Dendrobium catenatum TaxID=906689 RepID=A0A2I0VEC6_9ASPA|nr:piriformospora indica-insensitive protein 2 isoform X1 [Dendrobium catenatum]PKU61764.1 Piriformospora indica-insensitive protein 2 [Dendrobium catenatum]